MDGLIRGGARYDVLRRVEHKATYVCLRVATLQLLDQVAAISGVDLDDVAADRS